MLEGIAWEQVGIGSGWALVALFVVMVFRGDLVPRKQYEDKEHEASEWRTEGRLKDQHIDEQDIQLRYMAEVGKMMHAIMQAVQTIANRSGGSNEEMKL